MKKYINGFLFIILSFLSIFYFLSLILKYNTYLNNITNFINSISLCIISFLFIIFAIKISKKENSFFTLFLTSLFIAIISFNMIKDFNIIKAKEEKKLDNFINTNIQEVISWANKNKIELIQIYEHSDSFPEFHIISQSIKEGVLLDKINQLEVIISNGPDYEKTVIIPNMLSWDLDKVVEVIEKNYLNAVNINFIFSEEKRNSLIEQDKNGEMRRNEELRLTFSLGNEEDLKPMEVIDFTNKSLFETTLWLKKHGFEYSLKYEFNNEVKRNYIIKQNIKKGTTINPKEDNDIIITVSKGSKIKVPNLYEMDMEAIINWIIQNKLKIIFEEEYDEQIKLGQIIHTNYKEGDIIEEGTLISILISKGKIIIPNFKTVQEFHEWGTKYNVKIEEEYEFNNNIAQNNIIEIYPKVGTTLKNNEKIIITVSWGKAIIIPNFYNKTKSEVQTTCKNIGLSCYFKEGTYSTNIKKDNVTSQSKNSGLKVINGSSITLSLSKGTPQSYTFDYQEAWLKIGDANGTINYLTTKFKEIYPDIKFTFIKKADNSRQAGLIHESSPTNKGSNITQGNTYTIYIIE